MTKKLWKISKSKYGYDISWRWSDSEVTMYSNHIKKVWKTLRGATKWGLKEFGRDSENNGRL